MYNKVLHYMKNKIYVFNYLNFLYNIIQNIRYRYLQVFNLDQELKKNQIVMFTFLTHYIGRWHTRLLDK